MTVDSPVRTTPTKTRRSPAHRRLRLLQVLILAVGLTVAARLVWIQTAQSSDLALKAQAIQTDLVDLPAARGDIVDRNGNLLAGNRTTFQVSADETVSQAALQRLSQMSSVPVADLQARLLVCGQPGAQPGTCYRGQPGSPFRSCRTYPSRSLCRSTTPVCRASRSAGPRYATIPRRPMRHICSAICVRVRASRVWRRSTT